MLSISPFAEEVRAGRILRAYGTLLFAIRSSDYFQGKAG
jgi:hypothetical protein